MVQKYKAPVRIFKYPFELVMAAYEKRFPTCHLIPVFIGSDIINEHINDDGSIHIIERRCRISVDAPYLLRKITGVDHVLFIQRNTLNKRKRILKIEAKNESFNNHINIQELCYYRVSPDNDDWTIFEQEASLEIKSFWGFENVVERIAVKHYSQNIKKGQEIIEYHINELAQEGITSIPRFESNNNHNINDDDHDDEDDDIFNESSSLFSNNNFKKINNNHNNHNEQHKNHNNGIVISQSHDSIVHTNMIDNNNINDVNNLNNNHQKNKTNIIKNSKFDCIRSNSVEEKFQATRQKLLNKCENLQKKKNSLENDSIKNGNDDNNNNNNSNDSSLS